MQLGTDTPHSRLRHHAIPQISSTGVGRTGNGSIAAVVICTGKPATVIRVVQPAAICAFEASPSFGMQRVHACGELMDSECGRITLSGVPMCIDGLIDCAVDLGVSAVGGVCTSEVIDGGVDGGCGHLGVLYVLRMKGDFRVRRSARRGVWWIHGLCLVL